MTPRIRPPSVTHEGPSGTAGRPDGAAAAQTQTMRIDFTTGGLGLRHASPEYCDRTV